MDVDYDDYTVLRREILPQGKSRAFINDTPVNLSILEQISLRLIDLHSQNDTVSLLQNEYQFQLLDALANNKETLGKYKRIREEYKSISESYQQLKLDAENAKASYELDHFLYQELFKLNLKEGMQEDLEHKHSALSNVDYLQNTLAEGIRIMETEAVGLLDLSLIHI